MTETDVAEERWLTLANDTTALQRAAEDGCTDSELADLFGVPEGRLVTQFASLLRKARAELRRRIRRAQLAAGEKGNADVLAVLAKAYLPKVRS